MDERERYLEMQKLVERQMNSITSKSMASGYHMSINNPESLLAHHPNHKKENNVFPILMDPPLLEPKRK